MSLTKRNRAACLLLVVAWTWALLISGAPAAGPDENNKNDSPKPNDGASKASATPIDQQRSQDRPAPRLSDIATRHPRFGGDFYGWLTNDAFLLARPDGDHPRGILYQRDLATGRETSLPVLTKLYDEADGGSILQISPDGKWVLWWTGKIHEIQIHGARLDGSGHFQIPKAKADTDNLYLFWLTDSRRFVELVMPHRNTFTQALVRALDKPDVAESVPIGDTNPLQAACSIAGTDIALAAGDLLLALPCSLRGYGAVEPNVVVGTSALFGPKALGDRTTPFAPPAKTTMLCGAAVSPWSDHIAWMVASEADENQATVSMNVSRLDGSDWLKVGSEATAAPDTGFGDHLEKFMISAPGGPQWLPDGKTLSFFYKGDLYTVPVLGEAVRGSHESKR